MSKHQCHKISGLFLTNGLSHQDGIVQDAHRKISHDLLWTLLKSGVCNEQDHGEENPPESNWFKTIVDLPASFASNPDYLHVLALNNRAKDIKNYTDSPNVSHEDFIVACLVPDVDGNLPAMVAALNNHKQALLQLLVPFVNGATKEELSKLVHHENLQGQKLLALVAVHRRSLLMAHGILVEMEAEVHEWNSFAVKQCFRNTLGSTVGAFDTMDLFQRIERKQGSQLLLTISAHFVRIFSMSFALRVFFMSLDIGTDVLLLLDYWHHDINQTKDVTEPTCLRQQDGLWLQSTNDDLNLTRLLMLDREQEIPLSCYPAVVSARTRFLTTVVFISMPWLLYVFELLRFRTLSRWIDTRFLLYGSTLKAPAWLLCYLLAFMAKLVGNMVLLVCWPLVALFRNFWFRFKYETSQSRRKVGEHRSMAREAHIIASRAQIIEVCTESSLQPLFQLYLVFLELIAWANSLQNQTPFSLKEALLYLVDSQKRQILSIFASVVALSASYTGQYRQNKDNSLGFGSSLVYFITINFFVVSRLLCFEMFAYYLGPGRFMIAMTAIIAHVVLVSFIHFVFSDSAVQCRRDTGQSFSEWLRQVLLVCHNCFVNGLANLYIHNNLEIFFVGTPNSNDCTLPRSKIPFSSIDVRQQTLVRQVVIDLLILLENVIMISLARHSTSVRNNFGEMYDIILVIILGSYFFAMLLKILFYLCCHPWSELIRRCSYSLSSKESEDESKMACFGTSCIIFGHHINCSLHKNLSTRIWKDSRHDAVRYKSIRIHNSSISV